MSQLLVVLVARQNVSSRSMVGAREYHACLVRSTLCLPKMFFQHAFFHCIVITWQNCHECNYVIRTQQATRYAQHNTWIALGRPGHMAAAGAFAGLLSQTTSSQCATHHGHHASRAVVTWLPQCLIFFPFICFLKKRDNYFFTGVNIFQKWYYSSNQRFILEVGSFDANISLEKYEQF